MKRNNDIYEVEEKDLVQLHKILSAVFNDNTTYEERENLYKKINNDPNIHLLGYYIEDILVGTATLNILTLPSGKEATIWDLTVKEEYRRLGIATKLMIQVEKIAKQENIEKIWLFSGFHRKNAHLLYKKLGYNENIDKAFVKEI